MFVFFQYEVQFPMFESMDSSKPMSDGAASASVAAGNPAFDVTRKTPSFTVFILDLTNQHFLTPDIVQLQGGPKTVSILTPPVSQA